MICDDNEALCTAFSVHIMSQMRSFCVFVAYVKGLLRSVNTESAMIFGILWETIKVFVSKDTFSKTNNQHPLYEIYVTLGLRKRWELATKYTCIKDNSHCALDEAPVTINPRTRWNNYLHETLIAIYLFQHKIRQNFWK